MPRSALLAALLAVFCAPAAARGDLYKWVDASGRFHVTDDLSQVPPKHRPDAEVKAREGAPLGSSGWNDINVESPAHREPIGVILPAGAAADESGGRTHAIQVRRAGRSIRVGALLNGSVTVPYIVDTGASINTIPRGVIDRLGIRIGDETPTTFVSGIGGKAMKVPVVTLRSVQIGTAVVEDVEMAVLDTMREGLLGMPYFNHFRVSLDPMAGGSPWRISTSTPSTASTAATTSRPGARSSGWFAGRSRTSSIGFARPRTRSTSPAASSRSAPATGKISSTRSTARRPAQGCPARGVSKSIPREGTPFPHLPAGCRARAPRFAQPPQPSPRGRGEKIATEGVTGPWHPAC